MERIKMGQKVGSVFPMNPNEVEEIPSQFETLIKIYKKVSKFCNDEEWTMKDFKSFRSKLAPRSIDEISCLEGLITAFLSFPKEKRELLANKMDEKFQFSILVERQRVIVIEEKTKERKECYRGVDRPFEMGDIITFSNAIWSESIRLANIDTSNILNDMLKSVSSKEALSLLTELLHANVEEMNRITATVLSDFDIHFSDFLRISELSLPLLMLRENIPLYIQEVIRRRIIALENENSLAMRAYISDRRDVMREQQAKKKRKQERYHLS